ncbi:30S ribosomal protein S6 [bacterium]|nr:30S ribosomal protein S6 [bacterium]
MENQKTYEMATIFRPELEETGFDPLIDIVENIILSAGGEMIAKDIWGMRELAYTIKKITSGYYVFYYFNAEPAAPHKIRDAIMLNENILRHMIVVSEYMPEHLKKGDGDGEA